MHIGFIQQSDKLGICRAVWAVVRGWMWYATRAPLCKGSWREAPEGLCSTVIQFWKCFGKKAFGNDFAAESSFLTMPWQNGGRTDIVRSDDGHTGKSTITTPQSPVCGLVTAPLIQGSPWVYGIRPRSIQRNRQIPICRTAALIR